MKVQLSHIISFLIGAGIIGIILWIRSENNGVVSQSSIQEIVFREQEKLKQQVKNKMNDKATIGDYKSKIENAASGIRNIASQNFVKGNSPDSVYNKKIYELYNAIDGARSGIFRNIYNAQQNSDDNPVSKELDNSFSNIDIQIFKFFRPLFDYFSQPNPSNENFRENAYKEILVSLNDSIGLKNRLNSIAGVMNNESNRLDILSKSIDVNIKEVEDVILSQNNSLRDVEKATKDRLLMVVVLPVFAIIIVLLFIIPYLYQGNDTIIKMFFEEKIILQVFTVFILVIAILLLGIGDKIKAETLGTLLGGISVYVLQNVMSNTGNGAKKPPEVSGG
ncbi:MAG: hypothetical protein IPP96_16275 [Chitinophagaceae bacterium]|nr:hypothetical protein [Chitinophagaceae bacterium]